MTTAYGLFWFGLEGTGRKWNGWWWPEFL